MLTERAQRFVRWIRDSQGWRSAPEEFAWVASSNWAAETSGIEPAGIVVGADEQLATISRS